MIIARYAVILFTFLISLTKISGQELKLSLRSDKSEYIEHEPVWIEIVLLNTGETDITVNQSFNPYSEHLKFELKNSKNREYDPFNMELEEVSRIEYILEKGKFIYDHVNLLNIFSEETDSFWFMLLRKGTYRLKVMYAFDELTAESNVLEFRVNKVKGDEREALELFRKGHNYSILPGKDHLATRAFLDFIDRYSGSVYLGNVYNKLFTSYHLLNDYDKALRFGEELIRKLPSSRFSEKMVFRIALIYNEQGKKDELKMKMKELAGKYGKKNKNIAINALSRIR